MRKYYVMSFGLGGNGAEGIENGNLFHSSWYIGPEELQRYLVPEHYDPESMEGCMLIDKRAVLENNPGLAFRSPMCNPRLRDDETDRLFDRSYLKDDFAVTLLREFAKAGWGAVIASGAVGGLDFVSPAAYVGWWRDKGARIGQVINGRAVWMDHPQDVDSGAAS